MQMKASTTPMQPSARKKDLLQGLYLHLLLHSLLFDLAQRIFKVLHHTYLKPPMLCLILWIKAFEQLLMVHEDLDLHLITIKATMNSFKYCLSNTERHIRQFVHFDGEFKLQNKHEMYGG